MEDILIRHCTVNDLPPLLPLIEQLGYPTSLDLLEKRFNKFIENLGSGVALASHQNQIVGWIAWSKSILFVSDKTRFHIEGLVIDKQFRQQGIGKKLIFFVEEIARQFSPVIIDLTSGVRRSGEGTHRFYQSIGYANEGHMAKLYFRKEL